ncbi:MAG TPA: hypothetical protein VLJ60_07740 [bacterium]|nr:hypothetical protein [bacterium]
MNKPSVIIIFMILTSVFSCGNAHNNLADDLETTEGIDFSDDLLVDQNFNESEINSDDDPDSGVDEDIEVDPCIGDLEIKTISELEEILHCTEIAGHLSFNKSDLEEISMPDLVSVKSLTIAQNSLLIAVAFPILQKMQGSLVLKENPVIETVLLPLLETSELVVIKNNYKLLSFSLPALKTALFIEIESNHVLTQINLNVIDNSLVVRITNNASLISFSMPVMTKIEGYFLFMQNMVIETFSLPKLDFVGEDFGVTSNYKLKSFSSPKLKKINKNLMIGGCAGTEGADCLYGAGNPELTSFDFSSLSFVGRDFGISYNYELPTSSAEALREQVLSREGIGGSIEISNNKD